MLRAILAWLLAVSAAAFASAQGTSQPAAFRAEEIEQLVAPIALYPDALVAQILMASTYPLEVVSAARWSKANPNLKGKALEDAMQKQSWDESVKSLTAFPQVLSMMNEKLDMTQRLGDAFLAQQKEVLAAIQRLRARAEQAGHLKSSREQAVSTVQEGGQTVVKIQPADPQVVYVPTYNPAVVYGPWPYPAYPPYYYYPPGYVPGAVFFSFTVGVAVGSALWGDCDWSRGDVNINRTNYNNFNRTNLQSANWQHKAEHRKGVQYRDPGSQQRFGGGERPGVDARESFRGRPEQSRLDIGSGGFEGLGDGARTRDFSDRGAASRGLANGGFGGGRSFAGGGGGRGGGRR